jgi:glyoxylase-like metal-dependent hydrolase (beta-lactamase superfamily II)
MRTLGAVLLLLCACTPTLPPADIAPTLKPLAENVWLHASHRDVARLGLVLSHGLVIRGAEGVLLVDTAWDAADTDEILRLVREEVGTPVAAAVVTHAHADKMGGMAALRLAGVRSFAHAISNQDAPPRGLEPASDTLFADGKRERFVMGAVVFHPGTGHTRDNLVVYYAPARVLFGGCLIRAGRARALPRGAHRGAKPRPARGPGVARSHDRARGARVASLNEQIFSRVAERVTASVTTEGFHAARSARSP